MDWTSLKNKFELLIKSQYLILPFDSRLLTYIFFLLIGLNKSKTKTYLPDPMASDNKLIESVVAIINFAL